MRAVVEADADGADGPSLPDVSLLVVQDGGVEHAPSPEELLAEKLSTIDASILAEASWSQGGGYSTRCLRQMQDNRLEYA